MGMRPTPSRPDASLGQRQVDDGPHAVGRVAVLGDAHRPHVHRAAGAGQLVDEGVERGAVDTGEPQQVVERLRVQGGAHLGEARRCGPPRRRSSTAPRSTSSFSAALASATSPPGRTGTCRSLIVVPNTADSTLDGTQ